MLLEGVDWQTKTEPALCPAAGSGHVVLENVAGRTQAVRAIAHSPLRVLLPRRTRRGAEATGSRGGKEGGMVVLGSYGGGLVAGDVLGVKVAAGEGTTSHIGTQSATKVYRAVDGVGASQVADVVVGPRAVMVWAPDAVMPFAGAVYRQSQQFSVAQDANLLVIDWVVSGRCARGERWAFDRYDSQLDVRVAGRRVLFDSLSLTPHDGPLDGPFRLGRFNCLANVFAVGQQFCDALDRQTPPKLTAKATDDLIASESRREQTAVLRWAGVSVEAVGEAMKKRLAGVFDCAGCDPWARRW